MYSKKLSDLFDFVRQNEPDLVKVVALVGCQKRIESQSRHQACLRCEVADFFLTWRPLPTEAEGDDEWIPVIGRCGNHMGLPRDDDGSLVLPIVPSPYCSSMVTNTQGK
jgi:hypothetical protein